ncbi:amino acid adenylation domain-containing protein [Nocardia carnea]|uniref:amino acid adenylation domain-containing protein n=1 Tax=Nocardia carnea TaxID=37328 RepID=UPI0024582586|nr:amino acid adenylation domain-containing protein [Nocardia carnea]
MTHRAEPVKCLIWDLDDTVWHGVVLEKDCPTPTPDALRTLRVLDERGILHAVASRGELAVATAQLRQHGIEELFSAIQVGWGPKSTAVRAVAESLNIGLESIAFVDNDPVERAEVAAAIPQVRTYPAEQVAELPELAEFIPEVITAEARQRRDYYRAERARRTCENEYAGSDADFLASLDLVLTVRRATAADLDRAHELTVRTHQLNTTGRTFDLAELRDLCGSPDHEVLVADLADRFGGYGTVGLAVTQRRGPDSVLLLTLMSCRVMSRGVGGPFIRFLTERARGAGLRPTAEFVPTPVNRVMLVTLRFAGFAVAATEGDLILLAHDPEHRFPAGAYVRVVYEMAAAELPDALFGQVRRVPDRPAVVVGDRSVTYRELDERTTALARRLVAAGVRPGTVVLVHLPQSLDAVLAALAVLRAGGAWWLAEPDGAVATVGAVADDLACAVAVVGGPVPASFPERMVIVDIRETPQVRAELPVAVPDNAPAYVITTSGSTGIPKAVVVTRANLAAMISGRCYGHGDGEEVTFAAMRVLWDGWLMVFAWGLTVGATNVLPDAAALGNAAALAELAVRQRATHLTATPSMYRLLLPGLTGLRATLRLVALAGEQVPVALVARHRELLPETVFVNEYGPTEATVTCIAHEVGAAPGTAVPIGTELRGTVAYVLDPDLRPVPSGTPGELYLGGAQVVPGYAARPARTAGVFVPDPFTPAPGARMYRTGDLAVRDSDGRLELRGRADGQVKVRGVRVERSGVEAVLESHPAVREAAVVDSVGPDGAIRLMAFCVAADPVADPPHARELIAHCRGSLVPQAVPNRFRFLPAIPLAAASTKRDEAALRALAAVADPAGPVSRHGWSDTERALAEIWQECLGHREFDRSDSFLDIGGDSHLIVRLHLGLEARWPGAIRVGRLFDLTTVEAQAAAIDDLSRSTEDELPTPLAFEL